MNPEQMVGGVREMADQWRYEVVSIGYPGVVHDRKIASEPHNLAEGWVGFDFASAFGCPVKIMNDTAMQALGSYQKGLLLFLGLGTGLPAGGWQNPIVQAFKGDPHWRDHLSFHEYFHGDNGAGLGASHQTGWTGSIARIMQLLSVTPEAVLSVGKKTDGWNTTKSMATVPHAGR